MTNANEGRDRPGTAELVCELLSPPSDRRDERWEKTCLFRVPDGTYYLKGEGGPLSRWGNYRNEGWGAEPVSEEEARDIAFRNLPEELFWKVFGESADADPPRQLDRPR